MIRIGKTVIHEFEWTNRKVSCGDTRMRAMTRWGIAQLTFGPDEKLIELPPMDRDELMALRSLVNHCLRVI